MAQNSADLKKCGWTNYYCVALLVFFNRSLFTTCTKDFIHCHNESKVNRFLINVCQLTIQFQLSCSRQKIGQILFWISIKEAAGKLFKHFLGSWHQKCTFLYEYSFKYRHTNSLFLSDLNTAIPALSTELRTT